MSGCYDRASTEVEIMWTNQHGTGQAANHLVNSQVILQYMCQPFPDGEKPLFDINSQFKFDTVRNGQTSQVPPFTPSHQESSKAAKTYGIHEPYNFYQSYNRRERNKGI